MSVYLQDDKILLDGSNVATSEDCCCDCMGACCHDTECDIELKSDCENSGGVFQGCDSVCDPNPCLPTCGCFFPWGDANLPGRFFANLRHEQCRSEQIGVSNIVYLAAWAEYGAADPIFNCNHCISHGGPGGTSINCGGEATVDCSALDCSFFCSDGFFHGGGGDCIDEPTTSVVVIGTTVTYTLTCTNGFGGTDELIDKYIFSNECIP